jgi:hypothetical protein
VFIGFFAKNSLPIYFGAWVVAHSVNQIRRRGFEPRSMVSATLPIVAAAAATIVLQLTYTSRGWNPLAYEPVMSTSPASYVLPAAMPVLASTGWDDVFSRVFAHPVDAAVAFDYKNSLIFMGAIATASLLAAVIAMRRQVAPSVLMLIVFSVLVTAAFTAILATGSAASLELSRHYRLVGYVWLPLIAHVAITARRAVAAVLMLVITVPCLYGVASFAANWRRHYAHRPSHSNRVRLTHLQMTPKFVRVLEMIDRDLPGESSVVVTPAPMYALEFTRARVLATSAVSDSAERIRRDRRAGTVENLIVIAEVPAMTSEQQQAWLQSFTSYQRWQSIDLDNQRLYMPLGQHVTPDWIQERVAGLASPW